MSLSLVGDIGGTNARFGLWQDGQLSAVQVLSTAAFATPEQAVLQYLSGRNLLPGNIASVCLAVAGPVSGDQFRFTNNHWELSRSSFCASLKIERLLLVNDFTAMALGMTHLKPDQLIQIRPGKAEAGAPAVVIGPGTGLGVSTLQPLADGRWMVLPGEGGHVDLPIANTSEAELWLKLQALLGHVRAEDVLSGAGLVNLYNAVCAVGGVEPELKTPAAVTSVALSGNSLAEQALEQFCIWLGRVAGNNVLTVGGRGGVYLVGGVVPRFAEFFQHSGFNRAFAEKGCMSRYFADIPVWLVTAEYPGLEGAGVALEQL
ncbi:glucokinase [Pseudomonas sp. TTU2014-080ASC]|uniref:glucokinase n=1 Tax=Pseudomonas sp. TTU2014-080ASC TaxID=1729724 RepID=UPI0007189E12|nr:glucokinase [Pseudomonas sp. TTU2014-080ASC]KRW61879.1 glucokinase [Pseudomonas sp. TTU2014-080ASC]